MSTNFVRHYNKENKFRYSGFQYNPNYERSRKWKRGNMMTLEELFKIHRLDRLTQVFPEQTLREILLENPEVRFGQGCEI